MSDWKINRSFFTAAIPGMIWSDKYINKFANEWGCTIEKIKNKKRLIDKKRRLVVEFIKTEAE